MTVSFIPPSTGAPPTRSPKDVADAPRPQTVEGAAEASRPQVPEIGAPAPRPRTPDQAPTETETQVEVAAISEEIGAAVEDVQKLVLGVRSLEFSIDKDGGGVILKVKSGDDEVVRQIPPEELISFRRRFRELVGVLLDEKA